MTSFDALPVAAAPDLGIGEGFSNSDHQHQIFSEVLTLPLETTWTNSTPSQPLRVLKAVDFCVISGVVNASTGGGRSNVIATLPVDWRPVETYRYWYMYSSLFQYWINIDPTTGQISTNTSNAQAVSDMNLHGLFYRMV